jgi:hypothetical protein
LGRDLWVRNLDALITRLRQLPDFISERYLGLLEQIKRMSPRMLDEAFDRVRQEIDNAMRQLDELMTPELAMAGPGGMRMPVPDSPRGADSMQMSSISDEISEEMHELSGGGRSISDRGHTADEMAGMAEEVVRGRGRIDRLERHHTVFVFILHAVQARRSGRAPQTLNRASGQGFRQIVDEIFPQALVNMERARHGDLHRILNDNLDELLEPQRVADRIARAAGEMRDHGWLMVQRGGRRAMLERLQHLTERELIDIVEEAYTRVYREHPGILSDEIMRETLAAIDAVRQGL